MAYNPNYCTWYYCTQQSTGRGDKRRRGGKEEDWVALSPTIATAQKCVIEGEGQGWTSPPLTTHYQTIIIQRRRSCGCEKEDEDALFTTETTAAIVRMGTTLATTSQIWCRGQERGNNMSCRSEQIKHQTSWRWGQVRQGERMKEDNTDQVTGGTSSAKATQQLIRRAPENNGEGGGRGSSPIQLDMEQHIYCWDKL